MATRSRPSGLAAAFAALRTHALAKPEATEHFPWGETAIKVKGKVFLFMYTDATKLSLSTKLPQSGSVALMLPFAKPTGYGLGKAGWVSAAFDAGDSPPVDMLCSWIDESYQAVAPAKLAALARDGAAAPATSTARKPTTATARKPTTTAARKTATRKPKVMAKSKPVARKTARTSRRGSR